MGIKGHIDVDLESAFNVILEAVDDQIFESLCRIGEEAVTIARTMPASRGFTDQTGNLRSSIGYIVVKDGKPVRLPAFETVQPKEKDVDGKALNGAQVGMNFAKNLAAQFTQGYTLIVVAGMNYAVHVESKGRDVLTTAEKESEKSIARHLADLVTNIQENF